MTAAPNKCQPGSAKGRPDWIVRENNPYDDGYWARFAGKKRPTGRRQRQGWDDCNRELLDEERP